MVPEDPAGESVVAGKPKIGSTDGMRSTQFDIAVSVTGKRKWYREELCCVRGLSRSRCERTEPRNGANLCNGPIKW